MTGDVQYLTLQDMIWINLQVTKTVNPYDFMKLEEGTFYQYAYGGSQNITTQASKFLSGFAKNAPFTQGNEKTALVGCLAFLKLNGFQVKLDSGMADAEMLASAMPAGEHHSRETHVVVAEVVAALGL